MDRLSRKSCSLSRTHRSWDDVNVAEPTVLLNPKTGEWWMYYTGSSAANPDDKKIGLAVSRDLKTWAKHPANPLFFAGRDWDRTICCPVVIFDEGVFKMWYTSEGIAGEDVQIGYATSPDGIKWTRHPQPVIRLGPSDALDSRQAGLPSVLRDGDVLRMWYTGEGPDTAFRILYAESRDGVNWAKSRKPALDIGPEGSWDSLGVEQAWVVKDGSIYKMWYVGLDPKRETAEGLFPGVFGYAECEAGCFGK